MYEYTQASTSTKEIVVVESKIDLLTGILRRKECAVVPETTASDVYERLGGNGAGAGGGVVWSIVGYGDGPRVATILSLGNVRLTVGEVRLVDL